MTDRPQRQNAQAPSPDYVSIDALRALSQIRGWRVASAIALNWALILAAIFAALSPGHSIAYAVAALVVASRQYALLLLVHECAHYLFRQRRSDMPLSWATNDLIGNLFCAWPVGISVQRYRKLHFQHHKHLGTNRDPDHEYYRQRVTFGRLVIIVLGGLTGLRALITALLYYLPGRGSQPPAGRSPADSSREGTADDGSRTLRGAIVVQLVIAGAFVASGNWWAYFVLWLLPVLTIVPTLNHLRTIAEHSPDADLSREVPVAITRTNVTNVFERELLGPVQFCYHHEHHMFPSVPFYNLRALHRILVEAGYYDRERACLKGTYVGALIELGRQRGAASFATSFQKPP